MTNLKNKVKYLLSNDNFNEISMTALVGLLMLFQRFFTGIYKPVMDDWFLYGDLYTSVSDRLNNFAIPNEKFTIRPFAGIADIFINAPLFKHLWIVELILTLSLLFGTYLIIKTLRRNKLGNTGFLLCLVCLCPVGLEATYWIAAATRVSYSILFIGGAIYSLDYYYKSQNYIGFIMFCILGIFSVGFYEPAIVIYIILTLFVVWSNFKNKKDLIPAIIMIVHVAFIGIYYIINSGTGEIESRGGIVDSNFFSHIVKVFEYIKQIFTEYSSYIISNGFSNGINVMSYLTRVILLAVSIIFGVFTAIYLKKNPFSFKILLLGICMFFGGIILNFILNSERIPLRLVYFSYIGIGIIVDEIITLLPKIPAKIIAAILCSTCAFIFTVSGVGEVMEYQNTSDYDEYIAKQMINLDSDGNLTNPDKNSYLFDAQFYYDESGCIRYQDHIRSATSTYADLTGCIRHLTKTAFTNSIMTFPAGDIHKIKPYVDEKDLCTFFVLNYDKTVSKANLTPNGENYIITRSDGTYAGELIKIDEYNYQFIVK